MMKLTFYVARIAMQSQQHKVREFENVRHVHLNFELQGCKAPKDLVGDLR